MAAPRNTNVIFDELKRVIEDIDNLVGTPVSNLYGIIKTPTLTSTPSGNNVWYVSSGGSFPSIPSLYELANILARDQVGYDVVTDPDTEVSYTPPPEARHHSHLFLASTIISGSREFPIEINAPGYYADIYVNNILVASGRGSVYKTLTLHSERQNLAIICHGGTGAIGIKTPSNTQIRGQIPRPEAPLWSGVPSSDFLEATERDSTNTLAWRNDPFAGAWRVYRAEGLGLANPESAVDNADGTFDITFSGEDLEGATVGSTLYNEDFIAGTIISRASGAGDTTFTVRPSNWADPNVANWTGYDFYYAGKFHAVATVSYNDASTITWADTDIAQDTLYLYRVSALDFITATVESVQSREQPVWVKGQHRLNSGYLTAIPFVVEGTVSIEEFIRPDGIITDDWNSGTYTDIDEVIHNDGDFIATEFGSAIFPEFDLFEFETTLSNPSETPGTTAQGMRVILRARKNEISGLSWAALYVKLKQGTTTIHSRYITKEELEESYKVFILTLPANQIALITDHTDLRVELVAELSILAGQAAVLVSVVELEYFALEPEQRGHKVKLHYNITNSVDDLNFQLNWNDEVPSAQSYSYTKADVSGQDGTELLQGPTGDFFFKEDYSDLVVTATPVAQPGTHLGTSLRLELEQFLESGAGTSFKATTGAILKADYAVAGTNIVIDTDSSGRPRISSSGVAGGNIGDLSDVTIDSPGNGEVLTYNSGTGEWENAPSGGVTDPLLLDTGSASVPTYAFSTDPDTGMYLAAVADLSWAVGGSRRASLTATKLTIFGALEAQSVNGLSITPPSDQDTDLLTLNVTGVPKLWWDESESAVVLNIGGSAKITIASTSWTSHVPLLMGATTAYLTGAGVFLGNDSGTDKFHVGDPAGAHFRWNGSALAVIGQIIGVTNFDSGVISSRAEAVECLNGDFEGGLSFWGASSSNLALETSIVRAGSNSLKLDKFTASVVDCYQTTDGRNEPLTAGSLHKMRVAVGDEVWLRGYYRTDGTLGARVGIRQFDEDAVHVSWQLFAESATTSWTAFSHKITIPSGVEFITITLSTENTATTGAVYYDDIRITPLVGTNELVDLAVIASKIDDGAVETAKLLEDAVTYDKIAVNAIGVRQLFVGSFDNLVQNPGFEQDNGSLGSGWVVAVAGGGTWARNTSTPRSGAAAVQYTATSQSSLAWLQNSSIGLDVTDGMAITEGDQIYAECYARSATAGTWNTVLIGLVFRDETGAFVSSVAGTAISPTTSYQKITVTGTAPAGATIVFVGPFVEHDGLGGVLIFDDFYARRRLEGNLIVDGAIVADHLDVGTLEAVAGDMGTLNAGQILVGTAPDRILIDATAKAILMGAATSATSGKGIFLGKDGSEYQFRAGDPAGNYIIFDGTILEINTETFTGNNPVFTGSVEIEGGEGNTVIELISFDSGGFIGFRNTSGVQKGSIGYDGGGDRLVVSTAGLRPLVLNGSTVSIGTNAPGIRGIYTDEVTWDPASIGSGATVTTNLTVAGAVAGDAVFVSHEYTSNFPALILVAWVAAANTVTLSLHNTSGGSLNPPSETIRVVVIGAP